MREYIIRLIDCGMPRDVAVCVCRIFARRNDYCGLEEYVYSVEEETKMEVDES